jgi:hypothetical protein
MLQTAKVVQGSGYGYSWNVMTANSDQAKNTGLFAVDDVNVTDVMTTANIPWRHWVTAYAVDDREITMNTGPAQIVDLLKVRRADAMIAQVEFAEDQFWADPADDGESIFGLKYWIVQDSGNLEGFYGEDPTNFSSGAGGLAVADYPNWANYTATYTAVSKTDLIRKWRRAATMTKFKPPTEMPSYNTGDRYGYFTNYDVLGVLEELLEDQNDNLGNDLASKDGKTLFRRIPVTWVPKLDNDSLDPVYGIDWGVFGARFLEGFFMREQGMKRAPNQHTVLQNFIDNSLNLCCTDRRRLFVISL